MNQLHTIYVYDHRMMQVYRHLNAIYDENSPKQIRVLKKDNSNISAHSTQKKKQFKPPKLIAHGVSYDSDGCDELPYSPRMSCSPEPPKEPFKRIQLNEARHDLLKHKILYHGLFKVYSPHFHRYIDIAGLLTVDRLYLVSAIKYQLWEDFALRTKIHSLINHSIQNEDEDIDIEMAQKLIKNMDIFEDDDRMREIAISLEDQTKKEIMLKMLLNTFDRDKMRKLSTYFESNQDGKESAKETKYIKIKIPQELNGDLLEYILADIEWMDQEIQNDSIVITFCDYHYKEKILKELNHRKKIYLMQNGLIHEDAVEIAEYKGNKIKYTLTEIHAIDLKEYECVAAVNMYDSFGFCIESKNEADNMRMRTASNNIRHEWITHLDYVLYCIQKQEKQSVQIKADEMSEQSAKWMHNNTLKQLNLLQRIVKNKTVEWSAIQKRVKLLSKRLRKTQEINIQWMQYQNQKDDIKQNVEYETKELEATMIEYMNHGQFIQFASDKLNGWISSNNDDQNTKIVEVFKEYISDSKLSGKLYLDSPRKVILNWMKTKLSAHNIKIGAILKCSTFLKKEIESYNERILQTIENKEQSATKQFGVKYYLKLYSYFCASQRSFVCIRNPFQFPMYLKAALFSKYIDVYDVLSLENEDEEKKYKDDVNDDEKKLDKKINALSLIKLTDIFYNVENVFFMDLSYNEMVDHCSQICESVIEFVNNDKNIEHKRLNEIIFESVDLEDSKYSPSLYRMVKKYQLKSPNINMSYVFHLESIHTFKFKLQDYN